MKYIHLKLITKIISKVLSRSNLMIMETSLTAYLDRLRREEKIILVIMISLALKVRKQKLLPTQGEVLQELSWEFSLIKSVFQSKFYKVKFPVEINHKIAILSFKFKVLKIIRLLTTPVRPLTWGKRRIENWQSWNLGKDNMTRRQCWQVIDLILNSRL